MSDLIKGLGRLTLTIIMMAIPVLTTLAHVYHWNLFVTILLTIFFVVETLFLQFLIWKIE